MPFYHNPFITEYDNNEVDLVEEESINEAIMFQFVKKKDIPEDFRKFSYSIVEIIENQMTKKLGFGMPGAYGLRFGKVKEKIKKKPIRNCYIISIPYKGIIQAQGFEKAFSDNLVISIPIATKYLKSIMQKCGVKEYNNSGIYIKKNRDCIYAINWIINGGIFLYIRCLTNSEHNLDAMSGGKRFIEEASIFKDVKFL